MRSIIIKERPYREHIFSSISCQIKMEIKNKNPQYHFINNKYLQKVTHPTFARFATEKESEIIKRSASVPFETSLQLQNRWINYYNNVITAERPKIQTASRYFFIFDCSTETSKADRRFKIEERIRQLLSKEYLFKQKHW